MPPEFDDGFEFGVAPYMVITHRRRGATVFRDVLCPKCFAELPLEQQTQFSSVGRIAVTAEPWRGDREPVCTACHDAAMEV